MRVSAKAEYACLAVLDLALHYGAAEPMRIRRIAQANHIPQGFLVQIMQQLKAAGYVSSTRGSMGGYQLARAPEQISLADVLGCIDGPRRVDYHLASTGLTPSLRVIRSAWQEMAELTEESLERITFGELVERAREQAGMPVVGDWI
jgi:Rrf2 family protein